MGVYQLNHYLRNNCLTGITQIPFAQLTGKSIAIDTSIYLYRFISEGALLENMYLFISLLRKHSIIPLFVFDGKSREGKEQCLKNRAMVKKFAEEKYNTIIQNRQYSTDARQMVELRRKFVRIDDNIIAQTKELMDAYGIEWHQCEGEADGFIAKLVKKRVVWGCLSDDTDMFVYGCPNILRCVSILNETFIMYNMKSILNELGLPFVEFKEICILAGTDYNSSNISIYDIVDYHKKYKTQSNTAKIMKSSFYSWIEDETKIIGDYSEIMNAYDMFDTTNISIQNIKPRFKSIDIIDLKRIMTNEGFIFI